MDISYFGFLISMMDVSGASPTETPCLQTSSKEFGPPLPLLTSREQQVGRDKPLTTCNCPLAIALWYLFRFLLTVLQIFKSQDSQVNLIQAEVMPSQSPGMEKT